MTERPILMSAPMVRACLAGTKTQTRRVIKPPVGLSIPSRMEVKIWDGDGPAQAWWPNCGGNVATSTFCPIPCLYGRPGDRLWVRENGWERPDRTPLMMREGADTWLPYYYDADADEHEQLKAWGFKRRPSIHMPRWACRLVLEVTAVRVERLQDISQADAKAEGVESMTIADGGFVPASGTDYVRPYKNLWDSLNAARGFGWAINPWVWVVSFKRAESLKAAA